MAKWSDSCCFKLGTIVEDVPEQAEFNITIKDPDTLDIIESVSVITRDGKEVQPTEECIFILINILLNNRVFLH